MHQPLVVFLASASEGLALASEVQAVLENQEGFVPKIWNKDTFEKSLTFIESLEEALDRSDFAIVTLTPDDRSTVRRKKRMTPRDNVIFELGLFMGRLGPTGRLGRERTYFIFDEADDLKIPTDLLGVEAATFSAEAHGDRSKAIAEACASLIKRMRKLGPRLDKRTSAEQIAIEQTRAFCEKTAGVWWQHVTTQDEVKVSLCWITPQHATTTVSMEGLALDREGRVIADWKSVAVGVRSAERTLLYSWEGKHGSKKGFEGFGQYSFFESGASYEAGSGVFADLRGRDAPVLWKEVALRRIHPSKVERVRTLVEQGDDRARKSIVDEVLAEFGNAPLEATAPGRA